MRNRRTVERPQIEAQIQKQRLERERAEEERKQREGGKMRGGQAWQGRRKIVVMCVLGCALLILGQNWAQNADVQQQRQPADELLGQGKAWTSLSSILGIGARRRKAISSMVAAAEKKLQVTTVVRRRRRLRLVYTLYLLLA